MAKAKAAPEASVPQAAVPSSSFLTQCEKSLAAYYRSEGVDAKSVAQRVERQLHWLFPNLKQAQAKS